MITIDFETEAIVGNPSVNPPVPVGVAIKHTGKPARYYGWGHPTGNNSTHKQALVKLSAAVASGEPLLFQNAKFDLSVMSRYFNLTPKVLVDDTLFLIFLENPYADTFSLKPSAERILGIKPEERDVVQEWVLSHVACKPSEWGAHIAKAPGEIVGPYCIGDVDRTEALYYHLITKMPHAPYEREKKLLPIVMRSEQKGVKVDVERLGRDMLMQEKALLRCDDDLRKLLRNDNVNLDSGEELADALDAAGMVSGWQLTPTGRRSTARAALESVVTHPELRVLLKYRGALSHCLSNFGRPWQALSSQYNGRMHPEWNQVRQARGNDVKGTRTGRLSCSNPNFQNPPNEYDLQVPPGYPPLPLMRQYLVPDKGMMWIKRDYSQQELRILAHFSEGRLFQRYQEDPTIDAHDETKELIQEYTGLDLPRKHVKITGFSVIYGSGVTGLSEQLGVSYGDAGAVRNAYFTALPEVPKLMKDCTRRGMMNIPITTWGGRGYLAEPPKIVKGKMRRYEYKLLNYLIQGSAADQTKEAIIRWDADMGNADFLATVHDEINGQAPKESWKQDMGLLREAMEGIEFDVKMLSDGFYGKSWGELKDCK